MAAFNMIKSMHFHKQIMAITLGFIFINFIPTISAQEVQSNNKGNLEIGIGCNFLGPVNKMEELMIKYQFDATTVNWLFGGTTEHPHYSALGFSAHIAYSRNINTQSSTGIRISYSGLREIYGATENQEYLFIRFSNISIVPFFAYELSKSFELQSGPALMINAGNRTSMSAVNAENYTKISPGLLAGINLKIWNRRISYGKLGAIYLLTFPNKMGPYSTNSLNTIKTIPENKIGFSHLNLIFSCGIKL